MFMFSFAPLQEFSVNLFLNQLDLLCISPTWLREDTCNRGLYYLLSFGHLLPQNGRYLLTMNNEHVHSYSAMNMYIYIVHCSHL